MSTNPGENTLFKKLSKLLIFPLLFITGQLSAQTTLIPKDTPILTKRSPGDTTLPQRKRPTGIVSRQDSVRQQIDTFRLPVSADSLDAPVIYEASDSGVLDIKTKTFVLYGQAKTKYKTMDLKASVIHLDNEKGMAKAYYTKDSLGKVIERPVLVDGEMTSESDSMFYNFKTQRGLTKSTYTKQGEMFVYAERIKKIDAQSFFASQGRFTTCNLDTPHFAFRAKKLKLVNQKWAYSGLAYPEFESVPMPIGVPFGIYPLSRGRHSGLLAPSFNTTESFGVGMTGLGYYKALNDHFDIMLRTDLYSYGGFALHLTPNYRVRYRYNGGLRLDFSKTRVNFKGDPDYLNSNNFNVSWFHNMDSKARPGTNFGANVSFSTPGHNRSMVYNPNLAFMNRITSSIQYSKTWMQGKYNLSLIGSHDQENQTGLYNVSLPTATFTVNTFYPLRPADYDGVAKWYHKLGIGYNGQLQNRFSFYITDTPFKKRPNFEHILDTMQWGARHSIPISLTLPSLGPINVSPSVGYSEAWYGRQLLKKWNGDTKKLDTTYSKGFYTARELTFGIGVQTAIFGKLNFKKTSNIQAIRHVIRPSISANYKPDMQKKYYYTTQINTKGDIGNFSVFDGNINGPFSPGRFGGLSFGLQNNLEMKVKNKQDTTGENATKKIRLIDNFDIRSGYNFLADSCKLEPISLLLGTTLFEKINFTASAQLMPYQLNSYGAKTRKYAWEGDKFSLGSISNGSVSVSANFQSKKSDKQKKDNEHLVDDGMMVTPDEQLRQEEYIRNNPGEFADFNIPWTLSTGLSLTFYKQPLPDYSGFKTVFTTHLSLNGDFNISPKWKMGANSNIDLRMRKIGNLNVFLSRDLHCWQMSINVTPIGYYRSFNITVSPRSSILRDLKVNRTRAFYN